MILNEVSFSRRKIVFDVQNETAITLGHSKFTLNAIIRSLYLVYYSLNVAFVQFRNILSTVYDILKQVKLPFLNCLCSSPIAKAHGL